MTTLLPLVLLACTTPPDLMTGKVVDIWGTPIEGATVMVVGLNERPLTDSEGRYELHRVPGSHEIKAGRKGYIQEKSTLEVREGEKSQAPLFELYPMPEDLGFYVVTPGSYQHLEPAVVHGVGNELRAYRGIKTKGEVSTDPEGFEVIFHTNLSLDEIHRLGLQLRRVDYVREAKMAGPLGSATVKVNLYVDGGDVPITIEPMHSRSDFRITPKAPLEPGVYAFQTQDLLNPGENEQFNQIPEEFRRVYPLDLH